MNPNRRTGLQLKVTALLLLIGLAPLFASALLIDKMAQAAQNFASNEAARLRVRLEQARDAYRVAVDAKKRSYDHLADQVEEAGSATEEHFTSLAARMFDGEPDLLAIEVRLPDRAPFVRERAKPGLGGPTRFRVRTVERDDGRIALRFAADEDLQKSSEDLLRVLQEESTVGGYRKQLPDYYRNLFLVLVGGVVVVAAGGGIFLARRFTGRIADLVTGTRKVASGDLGARVAVSGRDELGELAGAFNRMVEDIERDRRQILYLQRIGAWQDVARRLAHEIKNPLTPIQLAVQELVSSYQGDDARHRKMLADAAEIVGEEIASLRRLVDAFSALGRLPPVEPHPLDLATVADDLGKDPGLGPHLEVAPPEEPVTVAGDRLLLRRLLANLVENGIHASGGGEAARVRLSWRCDPGERVARVTVEDAGPGVPDADRERIFEPYVTSKETGTGLGLAIAKKIALDHQGDLAVAPERGALGGARFLLTLPLAESPGSA